MSALMRASQETLMADVLALSSFGRSGTGELTRLSWSKPCYAAARWLCDRFAQAGLEAWIDDVGNVFGRLAGKSTEVILTGSHYDTVVNAGMFDGTAGVFAGLEAARILKNTGRRLRHTLMIAAFTEEEGLVVGGLFGSRAFIGSMGPDHPDVRKAAELGVSWDAVLESGRRRPEKIACYLEMHPEQGGVLERAHTPIGVVDAIVGYERYEISVFGHSNHAGSTPMDLRDDALMKAAELMLFLRKIVREIDPGMVCTFGGIRAIPGVYNTIPRQVDLLLDVRAVRAESIREFLRALEGRLPREQMKIVRTLQEPVVPMDTKVCAAIDRAAEKLRVRKMHMPSGAAHDATALSKVTRCGMIFVPSIGGVSHSPLEKTEWSDLRLGTDVLLQTILNLDETL